MPDQMPDHMPDDGADHGLPAEVVGVRRETLDTTTLTLRPSAAWAGFRAGQHVRVGVEVDGVRHTGCYAISSSDQSQRLRGDRTLALTLRCHDDGRVSRRLARRTSPGSVLHLSRATGDFVLPQQLPPRLLIISGGAGITPAMSMLRSLVDLRHRGRTTFVHYARSPEETVFGSELDELAAHPRIDLTVVHTRTGGTRLSQLQLQGLAPGHLDTPTWACGPAGLLRTLEELYDGRGDLRVERLGSTCPTHAPPPLG